jgi:hypothetical protein
VRFVRADVRDLAALLELYEIDALVECSAEPAALMGSPATSRTRRGQILTRPAACVDLWYTTGIRLATGYRW